jgi:8-oxo-dGTP pyrophosphatase MutT (NUDIX family)
VVSVTRELIYDGKVIRVAKLENRWEVVEHASAVAVLVVLQRNGQDEVLLVSQDRPAIGQTTWELPAGLVDAGETPEEAARRELAEEVGLDGTLTQIAEAFSSPGFTDEKIYLFEASDLFERALPGDEDDGFKAEWKSLADLWREIAGGGVASSTPTLLGLTYALGKRGGLL